MWNFTTALLSASALLQRGTRPAAATGCADASLSSAHLAADPGWARAQRKLLRMRVEDQRAMAVVAEVGWGERHGGVPGLCPFHLG